MERKWLQHDYREVVTSNINNEFPELMKDSRASTQNAIIDNEKSEIWLLLLQCFSNESICDTVLGYMDFRPFVLAFVSEWHGLQSGPVALPSKVTAFTLCQTSSSHVLEGILGFGPQDLPIRLNVFGKKDHDPTYHINMALVRDNSFLQEDFIHQMEESPLIRIKHMELPMADTSKSQIIYSKDYIALVVHRTGRIHDPVQDNTLLC